MSDEKQFITYREAVAALPDHEEIHTFRQAGPALIGCDVNRKDILKDLKNAKEIEVGGSQCQKMNHAIVIYDITGPTFIQNKKGYFK